MLGTPKSCFQVLVQLTETILREKHLPQYLASIVKDIVRYGRVDLVIERCMNIQQQSNCGVAAAVLPTWNCLLEVHSENYTSSCVQQEHYTQFIPFQSCN